MNPPAQVSAGIGFSCAIQDSCYSEWEELTIQAKIVAFGVIQAARCEGVALPGQVRLLMELAWSFWKIHCELVVWLGFQVPAMEPFQLWCLEFGPIMDASKRQGRPHPEAQQALNNLLRSAVECLGMEVRRD